MEHNGTNSFGSLNVTILTYAPRSSSSSTTARCEGSILRDFTTGFNCTSLATEEKNERFDVSVCRVEMSCATKSSSLLRGTQEVLFGLPDTFQTIEYYVTNSFWDDQVPPITIRNTVTPERRNPVLGPAFASGVASARVLVGTKANPTTINIEATRSFRNDTRAGQTCDTRGLQLSWIDEQAVAAVDEGTAEGRHYVAVAFHVQSATYQRTLGDKLSFENRLGVVLTYMLSVIAFLKIVKTVIQLLVDYVYKRRPLSKQPEDVQIRHNVLNEVDGVVRRNEGNGEGGAGGGGGAAGGDIEMTPIGGGGGGGGGRQRLKASNPRKRQQQRRFSAPSSFLTGEDTGRIALLEADNRVQKEQNRVQKVQMARLQGQIAALLAAADVRIEDESNHQQQQAATPPPPIMNWQENPIQESMKPKL